MVERWINGLYAAPLGCETDKELLAPLFRRIAGGEGYQDGYL
jgi:hypothetical protein